jgi:protein arginine kinase
LVYFPYSPRSFAGRIGSWLRPEGPESDVVVSCRIRLARNVDGYPFISRLESGRAAELAAKLQESLLEAKLDGETLWIPMSDATPVLRLLLRERNLISRDLAPLEDGGSALPGRAVAFGDSETVSVMVNEEDHLRLQAMASGFDLQLAWQRAQVLDRYLEERIQFAFTPKLGYLTGCPTNVGTGLRASVMMHLPALSLVKSELGKVITAAQRTGLAVRGMQGEGSRAVGDFYQISNQVTLGRSETKLVEDLRHLVPVIVEFERKLRATLLTEQRAALQDRVSRSLGVLRTAPSLRTDTALGHLSMLRMGLHLGLVPGPRIELLNELAIHVQKGHIQALFGEDDETPVPEASDQDAHRAVYLRRRLA